MKIPSFDFDGSLLLFTEIVIVYWKKGIAPLMLP